MPDLSMQIGSSRSIAYIGGLNAAIQYLEPIGLDEVISSADHQIRHDLKYIVSPSDITYILSQLNTFEHLRVLEINDRRIFCYKSVYFDTPDLRNYLDAAYRRPYRTKVRIRTYIDSDSSVLEVKKRSARGQTIKERLAYDSSHSSELTLPGREFIAANGLATADRLEPSLTSSYQRATLVFSESAVRMTIDIGLAWHDWNGSSLSVPGLVLLETKSSTRGSYIDRILWSLGYRPAAISKYCTGLAALRPSLPANKWHRTLNHLARLSIDPPHECCISQGC